MQLGYYVKAIWDEDASVWCSESNIPGLVIEADTLSEFESLMNELAPEMLATNEGIHNAEVPVQFDVHRTRQFAIA